MLKLRFYLLAMVVWFFIFYNMERLIAPVNLASFVYLLAAAYALIVMVYSPIYRLSPVWLFILSLLPFALLKVVLGYEIGGLNLPVTVTEVVSFWITLFIAWQIGYGLDTLRSEIFRLTVGSSNIAVHPFKTAQAEFYREIRRARHYRRPAAVLSITPSQESIDLSINRFIQEAQNNIIRQYIVARTSDLLQTALKETDIIAMRNNHFLVLLPETEIQHLPMLIPRLIYEAKEKLGLTLKIGASTFPDDALTFESLIDYAEARMHETAAGEWMGKNTKVMPEKEPVKGSAPEPKQELNKADLLQ